MGSRRLVETFPSLAASVVMPHVAALAVIWLLACGFMWKFVLLGLIPLNADWVSFSFEPWKSSLAPRAPYNPELDDPALNQFPLRRTAFRILAGGGIPLWNPDILCGTPLLADSVALPFDPLGLPFFLSLSPPVAYGMAILCQLGLAGTGMYLFLTSLGLGWFAGLLGATTYMFNGTAVVWLEYSFFNGAFVWAPFAVFGLAMLRAGWTRLGVVVFPVSVGLLFLGATLQVALYMLLVILGYGLFCVCAVHREGFVRHVVALCALGLLGLMLAGAQVLPTAEFAALSQRRGDDLYGGLNFLRPRALPLLWAPRFYGDPLDGSYVGFRMLGRSFVGMHGGYVGLLPFLLAVLAVVNLRRSRETIFFLCIGAGLLAFLLALGSGLREGILRVLPTFEKLDSLRALCVYVLAGSVLAGLGAEALFRSADATRSRNGKAATYLCVAFAVCLLAVIALALRAAASDRPQGLGLYLAWLRQTYGSILLTRQIGVPLGLALLSMVALLIAARTGIPLPLRRTAVLGVVLLDLWYYGLGYNPFVRPEEVYPTTPAIDFLREQMGLFRVSGSDMASSDIIKGDFLTPNAASCYGLQDIRGKESLYWGRYRTYMETVDTTPGLRLRTAVHLQAYASPLLDVLNMKYVMTQRDIQSPGFELVHDGPVRVYRNANATERAFVADGVRWADSPQSASRALADKDASVVSAPVVESAGGADGRFMGQSHGGRAQVEMRGPCHARVHTAPETEGVLILSDSAFPGWRAFDEGRAKPVLRANYVLKAVCVSRGPRTVEFVYEPRSFRWGVAVSLLALAVLAGLAAIGVRAGVWA